MALTVVMLLLILTNPHAPFFVTLLNARGRAALRAVFTHHEHSKRKE
jgi:hypothetical protein